jgi:peptidoglycan hydrolase-like protein with peptidoglycan-binding domain
VRRLVGPGHALALQRTAGNRAVAAMVVQRLGDVEQQALGSPRFQGNPRLHQAFHNSPAMHIGESGEAVRLVQEALTEQGASMPGSTKPTGALDGGFGQETFDAVKDLQTRQGLAVDGIVGHDTLGELDRLGAGGPEPPLLEPKPGQEPGAIPLPGGLEVLVRPGGGDSLPGLGDLPNLIGFPGTKQPPSQTEATADDLADRAACDALPASQMGAAVNEVLTWQSQADDPRLVGRLASIVCFPPEYLVFVAGIAVGLPAPPADASQRSAMLGQVATTLDDFTAALELAKSPQVTNFGLPQLSEARAKRVADRIAALGSIARAQSSVSADQRSLGAAMLASGEVGKVDHKLLDNGRRYGADRLLEYFRTAFGGTVPATQEQTIEKPPQGVKQFKSCAIDPPPCDPLAPWCGIFASWALQSAGIALPPWSLQDGKGLNQRGGWRHLATGDSIQPGDLATRASGNHQALVTVVRPDGIETAEGNTNLGGGSGVEQAIGGKIVHKTYAGQGLTFADWDQGFWRPPGIGP